MSDPLHAVTDQLHSVADRLPSVADRLPSVTDQWHAVAGHLPSVPLPERLRPTPVHSRRPSLWLMLLGAGLAGALVVIVLRWRSGRTDSGANDTGGFDASRNGGLSSITPATASR